MRVIVFFDLPTENNKDIRNYNKFRKFLIKEGYLMMQKSVYTKLVLNPSAADAAKTRLSMNKPEKGLIQVLTITEKQYSSIDYILGATEHSEIDNLDRLVII